MTAGEGPGSVLDRKVYRGPGGVLIAGWVDGTPAASFNDGKTLWIPTMVLAQRIASQLSSDGAIKAVVTERYYKLPLANEARTADIETGGTRSGNVGRLFRSARILGIPMPYDHATLTEVCRRVVRDNDLKSAYIRPLVFYGAEGMGGCAPTT